MARTKNTRQIQLQSAVSDFLEGSGEIKGKGLGEEEENG